MDHCVCNAHSLLTTLAPSGDEPVWWNPLGSAAIDAAVVGAYRAQASAGSPWGLAPANYAESLTNWANPGTNDLTENNGVVPWVAATGWGHVTVQQKSFDTSIITLNANWVCFIQFANTIQIDGYGMGALSGGGAGNRSLNVLPNFNTTPDRVVYAQGGILAVQPRLVDGNLAVMANQGYRDGVVDGPIIPGGAISTHSVYIGALNVNGVANFWCTANILAAAIYDDASAFTPADISAIAAVITGSMHNL